MTADALEAKAHQLPGRLGSDKLAAIVHLLEVMIRDDEPVTEEDILRYREERPGLLSAMARAFPWTT